MGFRVSGGHGQVTTVNIFNFNRVASYLGGVGFHTIARVDTPIIMHESLSGVQRYVAGATNVNVAPVAAAPEWHRTTW